MELRHILLVDDGSIRDLDIPGRLTKMGYEVISLCDTSNAALAKSAKSNPDVVLLDFMHNVEIADTSTSAKVRAVLDIPVIYVSEASSVHAKKDGRLPISGVPIKQLDDDELSAVIEKALDQHNRTIPPKRAGPEVLTESQILANAAKSKRNQADALNFVRHIPAFSELPEKAVLALIEKGQFAQVRAGEYISFEGGIQEASFIVVSGRLAMTKSSPAGKELTVELLGEGDFFGLVFALDELPNQLAARAQRDSEVLWIRTRALLRVLKEHPELYKRFTEHLSRRLHSSHLLSHGLAHNSVKVRIASLLLSLVAKFARVRVAASPIVIDITRQQIADLVGTTAETAIRVTRAMQSEGMIDVKSPGVVRIIDSEALSQLAEEYLDLV